MKEPVLVGYRLLRTSAPKTWNFGFVGAWQKMKMSLGTLYGARWLMTLLLIRLSLQGGGLDDVSLDEPEGGGLGFPSIYSEVIWESRYVSEGRDYLEGGGSITGFMSIGYDGAALDTSFREGIDPKYSELNIGPSYEYAFEDFVASAYYYHLRFLREDLNDHEVGVGLVYSGLPWDLKISLDSYYSFLWEGTFSLLALSTDWQISERLSLQPRAIFGINSGYVPDAHEGPNHLALRLDADYHLFGNIFFTGYLAQNWEIGREPYERRPGDYPLTDFLWGGLGVMVTF
jgi:hypothetical protein